MELGSIFASSSIIILANIQAFLLALHLRLRLTAINAENTPANMFFIVTLDLEYFRDSIHA